MFSVDNYAAYAKSPEALSLLEQTDNAYSNFQPRPNNPANYDEQEAFLKSKDTGVSWHIGGNGAGTSEVAAHKIARFVLTDQEPPRFDTPFWIIGETYEQVIGCIWKEKLFGHGHLPACEVEWDRVTWYDNRQALPLTIPLRPWPGGNKNHNWVLEFKSYEQGFAKMQARSVGGFCFSEQFPYSILLEVLRGCREYNFPGGKFVEFTPIDPAKSIEIEKMIEEDTLPKGWAVYGANTEEALKAGHVDPDWYEEFFGSVSEDMRETRQKGIFAKYEGSIYPGFNPKVHATAKSSQQLIVPPNCQHRRAIDWGSGPEHPFVCLWMARDGSGHWYIYDEYFSTSQTMTYLEHREIIEDRHDWSTEYHGVTYADPSRPDWIRVFNQSLAIQGARNDVMGGIECVRQHLKIDANGEPMMKIDRDACPNLMRQMRTYRWMKSTGKGANPTDAQPKPLKKDDDCVDALRYCLFTEQGMSGGGPTRRWNQRPLPRGAGFRRTR